MCVTCYRKWQSEGNDIPPVRCKVDGCNRAVLSLGYCSKHYREQNKALTRCIKPGCNEPVKARDMCSKHYQQWLTWRKIKKDTPLQEHRKAKGKICTVDGCKRPVLAREMCSMHYCRWQRNRLEKDEIEVPIDEVIVSEKEEQDDMISRHAYEKLHPALYRMKNPEKFNMCAYCGDDLTWSENGGTLLHEGRACDECTEMHRKNPWLEYGEKLQTWATKQWTRPKLKPPKKPLS